MDECKPLHMGKFAVELGEEYNALLKQSKHFILVRDPAAIAKSFSEAWAYSRSLFSST